MKWKVRKSHLSGTIAPPPSKSHTIRAVLIAALAGGTSEIRRPLPGSDGESALRAAAALGAGVTRHEDAVRIEGVGGVVDKGDTGLFCGNSGTTMRLFTSAAALGARPRRFDGDASLRTRPMRPLLDALRELGISYTCEDKGRDIPFVVTGPMHGGSATVGGVSSQFLSSLLLCCPLARADSTITVENLHERPYVEITLWWLRRMGIMHAVSADMSTYSIKGNQRYEPIDLSIPGDFSSATFGAVAGALRGADIALTGLDLSDPQGDKEIFHTLGQFGARVHQDHDRITVSEGRPLRGREADLNGMPDALPAMAVLGTAAEGMTRLSNVAQARIKETDRLAVMTRELRKMGALITEESDALVIQRSPLSGAAVDGHHDHRVVMALALAGMIAEGETVIDTAESADVTYPGFVESFRELGAEIEVVD